MQKSTLITVLRLFRPAEIELLRQLIDTPLFKLPNRHTDTTRLFQYLLPLAPNFDNEALILKEHVASVLFGHRAQPQTELRKAMSNLLGVLKKFLLFHQFTSASTTPGDVLLRQIQTDLGVLKWLSERSGDITKSSAQTKSILKGTQKARLLLSQQYHALQEATAQLSAPARLFNQRNYSEWLLSRFWQEYEMYEYFGMQRAPQEQQQHLLTTLEALDNFYYQLKMSMTLHLQVYLLTHIPLENEATAIIRLIENTRHLLQSPPEHLMDEPAYKLYTAIFQMLTSQSIDDPNYEVIDDLMHNKTVHLPDEVLQTLRVVLNAYCAFMYNRTGASVFLQRRLDLQKRDLEDELRYNGSTITATRLSGTVSNALLAGEQNYEWVADLLKKFPQGTGILATDTPREVYKVNYAHLLFYQKSYREAANELIGYDWYGRINDSQILLLAIRIDLKTQFELKKFDSDYITRVLDSAEKRIVRLSNINQQLQAMTLHFLRLIRQISLVKAKGKQFYSHEEWHSKIVEWDKYLQEKPIAEKKWLQELITKMAVEKAVF